MIDKKIYLYIILVISLLWIFRLRQEYLKLSKYKTAREIKISGRISNQPYQNNSKQIIEVGKFTLIGDEYPIYLYGDNIRAFGSLSYDVTDFKKPRLLLINPVINKNQIVGRRNASVGYKLMRLMLGLRRNIMQKISRLLPEPQASLLSGILLGVKKELPLSFAEALKNTGTMHVVVASGYNITVVAWAISYVVLAWVSRRWALPIIFCSIVAYTLMAGAEPPIIRAAIMAGLAFTAQFFGKQYNGLWAIWLAGAGMALVSPFIIFDIGFQLSFAATAGILLLTPVLIKVLGSFFGFFGRLITEELAVTLAAQLAVVPLLLVHFQKVSWLSPLVNLPIALLVPVIMAMGGLLAIVALISEGMAFVVSLLVWVPLTLFVKIVYWFDGLNFGVKSFEKIYWWWVLVYYLIILLLMLTVGKLQGVFSRRRSR